MRFFLAAVALALGACSQQPAPAEADDPRPHLEAPAADTQTVRAFVAANDSASQATGDIEASTSLRLPDAGQAGAADTQEVLTLRGADGLAVEASVMSAVSPATEVQGQTLRALLSLSVDEPQVLVYRVARETKPQGGRGLCGEGETAFLVVWEPAGAGAAAMKVLGLTGGAPGAADARSCAMLEYRGR